MKHLSFLKSMLALCLLVAVATLAFCGHAFAADAVQDAASPAATETYTMNFTQAVLAALGCAAMAFGVAITAVYHWAAKKWGWVSTVLPEEKFQALLDKLLTEGVSYAASKLQGSDWLQVETKNAAVASAVTYVLEHGGDALAQFGVTREKLEQKLEAKLVELGYLPGAQPAGT